MEVQYFRALICLLTLALHSSSSLASADGRAGAAVTVVLPVLSGRRLLNPSTSSSPASRTALSGDEERRKQEHGMVERPGIKEDPDERDQGAADDKGDEEEGLVYNVDYHGVITHPSPLPRHPKP